MTQVTMTQAQLERAVCRATGETRDVVQRMGFSLLIPPKPSRRQRWRRRWIYPFPKAASSEEQFRPKPA